MVCVIPILGALYNFFITPYGLIVVLALLALLFFNEIINLKKAVKNSDSSDDAKELLTEDSEF